MFLDATTLWPHRVEWCCGRSQHMMRIEFRDDTGELLAATAPATEGDPDWVRAITPEAIEQARAGPFLTLEEYRKQMGQQ